MSHDFKPKNFISRSFYAIAIFALIFGAGCALSSDHKKSDSSGDSAAKRMNIQILVGSMRVTKTGFDIAQNLASMLNSRAEIAIEIVDLADYNLPFYTDTMAPVNRKEDIVDPILKKWSDKILEADGFIIVAPEYNGGYPASLKNALDSLYKEWNNKPVALVGYSGGPTGGSSMLAQLRPVTLALKMIPVDTDIAIPYSWKAFTPDKKLVQAAEIEQKLNTIIDQFLAIDKK
jgi:NAD(P)H-dependent FMN reductase